MLRAFRTEINPSFGQRQTINQTIGTCRWMYNKFIETNQNFHKTGHSYMNGFAFSKWMNNVYLPSHPDKHWVKQSASKAVKQSIMNAHRAYQTFFKNKQGYPKFKKKSGIGSYYLIGTIHVQRHRIQLPKLGWVKLKEKGYIPTNNIKSATIVKEYDRYYVSVLVDQPPSPVFKSKQTEGIGIDLGLKEAVFTPSGVKIRSFKTNQMIVKLDKSLKRQQRKLSRKKKGSHNWYKQLLKVQRLYRCIKNIKRNIKRKGILSIVRTNPQFITVENLNIKGMMRNKRLANSFQQIGLGCIVEWLKIKCQDYGIELRQVDRFYPSSQICSDCCHIQPMPLNQRTYHCPHCGMIKDRDINASINLKQATDYTVIV
ncbi:putative transposase [Staphylococcus piscifermentans]|uniref:RNA-guided endonuclease InsQ/TnpB family protein n=5 Tax=Staphylococcus piscifermentans TaxID=70258 RepID=UPI000B9495D7|nr:RNA-guided endonuclease TnpB family protein [Staphylococcus piscifermentans]SNV09248.1 putative transposase [Staphylococcus piscifermentans]